MTELLINWAQESWRVLGQMAPYLLFGFLVAGILSVWISPEWVERHLGGRGFGAVIKAAFFGVPLPLCSCGVIPVAASIRRHGASRAATTSFLLSTPQTGVDSIAVTYALLGGMFALFRPVAALITGLVGGALVRAFGEQDTTAVAGATGTEACVEECCQPEASGSAVRRALRYGFVILPRDIGVALLVGVIVAGALTALVPPNQWQAYLGGGVISILMMMALGIPIYVCATASVPIAVGLLHLGASPGAALAFLVAGPATNAATVSITWKVLGKRTAVIYLLTIALSAVGSGLLLDGLFAWLPVSVPHVADAAHDHGTGIAWWPSATAVILLVVMAWSYRAGAARREGAAAGTVNGAAGAASSIPGDEGDRRPQRIELSVTGMTCSHCAETVTRALREQPGVQTVEMVLKSGRAVVGGEKLDGAALAAVVNQLGYSAKVR